jgi:hypothetical protein
VGDCGSLLPGSHPRRTHRHLTDQGKPRQTTGQECYLGNYLIASLLVPGGGFYFCVETSTVLSISCSVFCNLSLVIPLQEAF